MGEPLYEVLVVIGVFCVGLIVPLVFSARRSLEYSRRRVTCPETTRSATVTVGRDPKGRRRMRVAQCSELGDRPRCDAECLHQLDES